MTRKTEAEEVLIDDSPPSINPYEVLRLDAQASADQVKSAYRKQALKYHPGIYASARAHLIPTCERD